MEQRLKENLDAVHMPPACEARIRAALETRERSARPQRRGRRAGRLLLAAAVLVLSTSAVALSPSLREHLDWVLGGFAPYVQELEGPVAEDQGIRVRGISVLMDDYTSRAYVEIQDLTGEYPLDATAQVDGILERTEDPEHEEHGVSPNGYYASVSSFGCRTVGYDAEKRALLVELTRKDNQINRSGSFTVSISGLQPGIREEESTQRLPKSLLSGDTLASMTLEDGRIALEPGQTPWEIPGFQGASVSSVGFGPDGKLHIQFQFAEGIVARTENNHSFIAVTVTPKEGPDYYRLEEGELLFFEHEGRQYYEQIVLAGPEELDNLCFGEVYASLLTEEYIAGNWELTFDRVENLENTEWVVPEKVKEDKLWDEVLLSPMNCIIKGQEDMECPKKLTVYLEDGTQLLPKASGRSLGSRPGVVLWFWEFDAPLDLDQVTGIQVGDTVLSAGT